MNPAHFTLIAERLPGLEYHDEASPQWWSRGECLLLEPGQDASLSAALYADRQAPGWSVEALFSGTPAQALARIGPHLVALLPDSPSLTAIVQRLTGEPLGIVIRPRDGVGWSALVEHLRDRLWAKGVDGQPAITRWFDPRGLRALLSALTPVQREALAGPVESFIWHGGQGWYQWSPPAPAFSTASQAPALRFDAECVEQLARERLWDSAMTLASTYASCLPADPHVALHRVFAGLLAARECGYSTAREQERWLRLVLSDGGDFWRQPEAELLLRRDDLGLAQKLSELESLYLKGTTP